MSTHPRQGSFGARKRRLLRVLITGLLGWTAGTGCTTWSLFTVQPPPPPAESLVLRGDALVEEKPPATDSPEAKLAGAHELFRRAEYAKAADLFNYIREKKRYPDAVRIEATFYEAECLRLQARYPKAGDTYTALFKEWPNNPYREQATQHLYEIANYWLEDTRLRMKQTREKSEHKRFMVDQQLIHFDRTKPLVDEENRALEKLEQVHYTDINGSLGLGDKALFLAGAVKFYNEDFREADHFLSQIHENYPNSPLASQALELAIIAKTLSTGGADYDGKKVAEARVLVQTALRNYPDLAARRDEFLKSKMIGIQAQEAEKDYKLAEFYYRTKHLGSAWFYYKLIERRYATKERNSKYELLARKRLDEIRVKLEKQGKALPEETVQAPVVQATPVEPKSVPIDPGPPPGALPSSLDPGKPIR